MMKVALLILSCAMQSPNVEIWMFRILIVVRRAAYFILIVFTIAFLFSRRFDGLTCFFLNAGDGPFSCDGLISTSKS